MSAAYQRVAESLRHGISSGQWQPGDLLPSEHDLAREHGVSRNTVRQALATLADTNLIRRIQGKGSVVSEQGVSHVLGGLQSFTDTLIELGKKPGIRSITIRVDDNPPADARRFLPGSTTWLVQRIRTADGRPFCVMQSWLPDAIGAQLAAAGLDQTQSLYATMRERLGITPTEATEIIRAEAAAALEAHALEIKLGYPLLSMYRWTLGTGGQPIEYVRSAAPGDRYQYVIKLKQ